MLVFVQGTKKITAALKWLWIAFSIQLEKMSECVRFLRIKNYNLSPCGIRPSVFWHPC